MCRQAPRSRMTAIRRGQSRWKSKRENGQESMRSAAYCAAYAGSESSGSVRISRLACPDPAISWHTPPELSVTSRIRKAACRPIAPLMTSAPSPIVLPAGSSSLPLMLNWLPLSCMSCQIAFWPQVSGPVPASAPVKWTANRSRLAGSNIADCVQLRAARVNPLAAARPHHRRCRTIPAGATRPARSRPGWRRGCRSW